MTGRGRENGASPPEERDIPDARDDQEAGGAAPGEEQSGEDQSGEEQQGGDGGGILWMASAGGMTATADAFAVTEGERPGASQIWFISMVGAQTALRAVWASLLNTPPKPVYLTPGTGGLALEDRYHQCSIHGLSQGTWKVKMTKMANGMGYHAMAYTGLAEYAHDNENFVLLAREGENEREAHHRFLDRRVTLPMHPSWAGWLWERGLRTEEIIPMECVGVRAWLCMPNPPKLEADVGEAVRQHLIGV